MGAGPDPRLVHDSPRPEQLAAVMPESQPNEDRRQHARDLLGQLSVLTDDDPAREKIREELVILQMPLVRHLATRFRDRGEPLDDLIQVGTIGLINAIDRFDTSRDVEFSTFATPTILGEIKRHFRDRGWAIRVPRRLQEMRKSISTATETLTQSLGREPTVEDLAEHLGLGVEDILEGLESGLAYSTVPLDPLIDPDDESFGLAARLGSADPELAHVEERAVLAPHLAQLPERERLILKYRFVDGLTQMEIAESVGISQMHVSRVLTRTLAQLRNQLVANG